MFSVAVALARHATASGAAARGEDGGVAAAAASLIAACLQWEFKRAGTPSHAALTMVIGSFVTEKGHRMSVNQSAPRAR